MCAVSLSADPFGLWDPFVSDGCVPVVGTGACASFFTAARRTWWAPNGMAARTVFHWEKTSVTMVSTRTRSVVSLVGPDLFVSTFRWWVGGRVGDRFLPCPLLLAVPSLVSPTPPHLPPSFVFALLLLFFLPLPAAARRSRPGARGARTSRSVAALERGAGGRGEVEGDGRLEKARHELEVKGHGRLEQARCRQWARESRARSASSRRTRGHARARPTPARCGAERAYKCGWMAALLVGAKGA